MDFYVVRWQETPEGSTIRSEFFKADEAIVKQNELNDKGMVNVKLTKEPYPRKSFYV